MGQDLTSDISPVASARSQLRDGSLPLSRAGITKLELLVGARSSAVALALATLPSSQIGILAEELALPTFQDITVQAGLSHMITCGGLVTETLLDVNGQGACFLDFDGDGWLDVYLANGSSRSLDDAGKAPHDYLLRNRGDGTFADATEALGSGDTSWSSGCAVGDYDNDGDPDLYLTNYGPNKFYRNDGGRFRDVSDESGTAGPQWSPPKWSMGAGFGDVDGDGDLDLFVANFTDFDPVTSPPAPTQDSPCKLKGVPIVCAPDYYEGQQDLLYLNNGDGTFRDVSATAGIAQSEPGHGFAAVFSDLDDDGDQDLYVANDSGPNFYYENAGDGTFTDISWESGSMVNEHGEPEGSMGLTVGDYNNDGRLDIFVTNFVEQSNTLYENDGDNLFLDQTTSLGLDPVGFNYSGWGTKLFDFDNDGWLDLFVTNGHTDERLEQRYPADTYAEPNFLLRNEAGRRYVDVSERVGLREREPGVGRGTAFADFDNDGDIDVLVVNKNELPALLRNDGGNRRNWLAIRTRGEESNRDGMGAKVIVSAGRVRRLFEVRASDSYLSSNDPRVHVGLGDAVSADVEIRWPSGQVDGHEKLSAGNFYLAVEGRPIEAGQRPADAK